MEVETMKTAEILDALKHMTPLERLSLLEAALHQTREEMRRQQGAGTTINGGLEYSRTAEPFYVGGAAHDLREDEVHPYRGE
jgi:hypothetical protein